MLRAQIILGIALFLLAIFVVHFMAQTTTVVTFDNPVPPGSSDSLINGVFQGIDFGISQWRWSGPFGANSTNSVYFDSLSGTSRSFSFSPAPRILESIRVYTSTNGILTLSDGINPTVTQTVNTGSLQVITTGWTLGSAIVTANFTAGWAFGIDDITHRGLSRTDAGPPTVAITAPTNGSVVSGTIAVAANASDDIGVVGVQFLLDGANLGSKDTSAPYLANWNTATATDGSHSLTAVARDAAGNQTISSQVIITASNVPWASPSFSLRFRGNGVNDIDRVKIQIDDPTSNVPGPPADVGGVDFTIEFWMNAGVVENSSPAVQCGNNDNWIYGNVIFDRDRFNQDRSYGISLAGGRLVFGVSGDRTESRTICGAANLLDNQWHHVAVQRRRVDGWMWLYVDGILEAQGNGPGGDISYPDNGVPGYFCGPGRDQPCTNSDPYLVIGAEKHDAGRQFASYGGWIDEIRLSNTLRYGSSFARPSRPFAPDVNTAALYHFDEGQGDFVADSSGASGGPSNGVRRFGGSPAGPEWVGEAPFSGLIDTTPPTVSIVSPATGSTVSGTISVSAAAFDNMAVAGVQFQVDAVNVGAEDSTAPYAVALNTSTLTNGIHALAAVARDTANNRANSEAVTLTVSNTVPPSITELLPASIAAGSAGFTLRVNGTDFVPLSEVRWNGAVRTTTFVSASQLLAAIAAGDLAAVGTASVTVSNPFPGEGASNVQTFSITADPNGLVAAYAFNEGGGVVVRDASGNGNNGAIEGPTWTAPGRFGNALSFDGINDMVTVNPSNSLDLATGMTLEAWVNPTAAPSGWRAAIVKEQPGGVVYYLYPSGGSGDAPATAVYTGAEQTLFGESRLPVSIWTHLAATYDGTTQRLYVNGVEIAIGAQTGTIQTSANPLRIGGNGVFGEFFEGLIDEVRIYNRALTPVEIQTDMNSAVAP